MTKFWNFSNTSITCLRIFFEVADIIVKVYIFWKLLVCKAQKLCSFSCGVLDKNIIVQWNFEFFSWKKYCSTRNIFYTTDPTLKIMPFLDSLWNFHSENVYFFNTSIHGSWNNAAQSKIGAYIRSEKATFWCHAKIHQFKTHGLVL